MASFMGDRESLAPTKRKKRGAAAVAAKQPAVVEEEEEEEVPFKKLKKVKSPSQKAAPAVKIEPHEETEWTTEEYVELVARMKAVLPKNDTAKYCTGAANLNWDEIKFGNYSATECHHQWTQIIRKLRRYRIVTELVRDAEAWAHHPWDSYYRNKNKTLKIVPHPDKPKRPLTPYFRFFVERWPKVSQAHPGLGMTDISKLLSEKFRNLSVKKKSKYMTEYTAEREVYQSKYLKFQEEHHDLFDADALKKQHSSTELHNGEAVPTITTPISLYTAAKIEQHLQKRPRVPVKELQSLYKKGWLELSDAKKMKYIQKACEAKIEFDAKMSEFCEKYPDYKPKAKSFISKDEQRIKDLCEGKPSKPPSNGYGLYTSEQITELPDIPNNKRMSEVARLWKLLSEPERQVYAKQATKKTTAYKVKYALYLSNLSEEERGRIEAESKVKKMRIKTTPATKEALARPKEPISAMFLYINEQSEAYTKKHPSLNKDQLRKMLVREYAALTPTKKKKVPTATLR